MSDQISIGLSIFVEHGRELAASDFYAAAFGTQQIRTHTHDGAVIAVDLLLGTLPIFVVGANPKRQANPDLGGPFHPQTVGAVSTVLNLTVGDLDTVIGKAVAAGATIRDAAQLDDRGGRSAAVFDPFGHIWTLSERIAP